jgi:hypothetical protein
VTSSSPRNSRLGVRAPRRLAPLGGGARCRPEPRLLARSAIFGLTRATGENRWTLYRGNCRSEERPRSPFCLRNRTQKNRRVNDRTTNKRNTRRTPRSESTDGRRAEKSDLALWRLRYSCVIGAYPCRLSWLTGKQPPRCDSGKRASVTTTYMRYDYEPGNDRAGGNGSPPTTAAEPLGQVPEVRWNTTFEATTVGLRCSLFGSPPELGPRPPAAPQGWRIARAVSGD